MKLFSLIGLINFSVLLNFIFCPVIKAQVVPDNSLPNNSVVTPDGQVIQIEGGTRRGDNLFHSFEEFSVPAERTASFNNAVDIQNIFSRVTGNFRSEIDGALSTNGSASLFLINPNGIIFGDNASLNIGGSFLATTAESLIFEDGTQFETTNTQTTPILTITAPVGLGLGTNPGQIINRFQALRDESEVGLQVQPENTLALLGGEIVLEGGLISTNAGRIELGAVADNNTVGLISDDRGWTFDYEAVDSFEDINLSQSRIFNVGEQSAEIKIQGKDIALTENSQILLTASDFSAGRLNISAESIVLDGLGTRLSNQVTKTASGETGILNIETKQLSILNGAIVSSGTLGMGTGVDIQINASELVEIEGIDFGMTENGLRFAFSFLTTQAISPDLQENQPMGNQGDLTLTTKQLTLANGGQISTTTFTQNNAGNLAIIASDSILLQGRNLESGISSGIFAGVEGEGTGNGGSLRIETSQLTVLDGAQISTLTRNSGPGGDITIDVSDSIVLSGTFPSDDVETSRSNITVSAEDQASGDSGNLKLNTELLIIEKGAAVSVNNRGTGEGGNANLNIDRLIVRSRGRIGAGSLVDDDAVDNIRGDGGTITIDATDSIEVVGTSNIRGETENSTIFARSEGTGNSGSLSISAPNLTVAEFGSIDVSATGTGEAGSLSIDAQNVILNGGRLTAETREGDEGNINIDNADTLLLRNSKITTNAFESATGGDIAIDSEGIALLDNSSITANAERGQGGNIQITTQGILRELNSDIDAESEFGIDGTITFNTPDVDPVSGIQELPDVPIDTEAILAQDFCKLENERIAKGSSFTITGRGGLIPTSKDSLTNRDRLVDWARRKDIEVSQSGAVGIRQRKRNPDSENHLGIRQSQGLLVAKDGTTWLTANAPHTTTQNSQIAHPDCNTSD